MEMIAGIVIPFVSVIISVIALWLSSAANKKAVSAQNEANKLNARLVTIEEKREKDRVNQGVMAKLTPVVEDRGGKGNWLRIKNSGEGEARSVRLYVNDILASSENRKRLPVIFLTPSPSVIGAECESDPLCLFRPSLVEGTVSEIIIKVVWDDDSGNSRSTRNAVSVGG